MTTTLQYIANQNNAQRSTGPVTDAGKATVSQNALSHGIFAKELIVNSFENPQDYERLKHSLMASLKPTNAAQCLLVENIATDYWRLRRVYGYELQQFEVYGASLLKRMSKAVTDPETRDRVAADRTALKKEINQLTAIIKTLQTGKVTFEGDRWLGDGISLGIGWVLRMSLEECAHLALNPTDYRNFKTSYPSRAELYRMCQAAGLTDEAITSAAIASIDASRKKSVEHLGYLEQRVKRAENALQQLRQMKALPDADSAGRIVKYGKHVQRSIKENMSLLARLQGR